MAEPMIFQITVSESTGSAIAPGSGNHGYPCRGTETSAAGRKTELLRVISLIIDIVRTKPVQPFVSLKPETRGVGTLQGTVHVELAYKDTNAPYDHHFAY